LDALPLLIVAGRNVLLLTALVVLVVSLWRAAPPRERDQSAGSPSNPEAGRV